MLKPIEKLKLDFNFDRALLNKVYLMAKRVEQKKPEFDCNLIISGDEGSGKSTLSGEIGYIISQLTGRKFSYENFFFDYKSMLDFAKNNSSQIIISDEPALEGLASEWYKENQQNWLKFLMMGRKKRHFIIHNMTKFWKFPEYISTDRSVGLIYVYSRDNQNNGRFLYIPKKNLPYLYTDYNKKKLRSYAKYHQIHGSFPDVLGDLIDIDKYNQRKEDAIMSIGNKRSGDQFKLEAKYLKWAISRLNPYKNPIKSRADVENRLGLPPRTLEFWEKANKNTPLPKSFEEKGYFRPQNMSYKGIEPGDEGNMVDFPGEKHADNLDKLPLSFSEKNSNNKFVDGKSQDINRIVV